MIHVVLEDVLGFGDFELLVLIVDEVGDVEIEEQVKEIEEACNAEEERGLTASLAGNIVVT